LPDSDHYFNFKAETIENINKIMVKTDFKITLASSELKAFIKGGNLVEGF
jgi:hypothetical protein